MGEFHLTEYSFLRVKTLHDFNSCFVEFRRQTKQIWNDLSLKKRTSKAKSSVMRGGHVTITEILEENDVVYTRCYTVVILDRDQQRGTFPATAEM